MPRVSVVIPTRNRANLIQEALGSVLGQTYRDLEIVVVDDGSTDETPSVLSQYADQRLHTLRQDQQGTGAARNAGISAASGEYIAFLDDDDLWLPFKLERQMTLFDNSQDLMWVYADAYGFDGETQRALYIFSQQARQFEGDIAKQLLLSCFIPSPTPVIHRGVFEQVGCFCTAPMGEDWDMWLRVAHRYPIRRVPEVLAGYRVHKERLSGRHDLMSQHQWRMGIIERAVGLAPEAYRPLRGQAMAAECISTGRGLVRQGNIPQARTMFIQAIKHSPRAIGAYLFWTFTLLGARTSDVLALMDHLQSGVMAPSVERKSW